MADQDLTLEQSLALDLIGDMGNQITREGNTDRWRSNILANRRHFMKGNPDLTGLAVYIVAPGPSLEKNIHLLNDISERGVIIVLDAALRYTQLKGINAEYCMMIDGSEKMLKMIEGCDTTHTTLICTASACPEVIDMWKGPKFFVTTPHIHVDRIFNYHHLTRKVVAKKDIKEGDELILDEEYKVEFEGLNSLITTGGNVSTAAHHFALQYLKAQSIIFVGLDLSWEYQSHHYAGHEHEENVRARTERAGGEHIDVHGNRVMTNLSLLAFKRWHEQMSRQFKGSVVNATEGGIFGITQKGEKLDFIEFLNLEDAVRKYSPKGQHPPVIFSCNGHDAEKEKEEVFAT